MKHIKTFETIKEQKEEIIDKIFNTLLLITKNEIYFNILIYSHWKNNKIDSIYIDKRFNKVFANISTLYNRNSTKKELINAISINNLKKIEEYIKTNYTIEYENSYLAIKLNKYNL